MSARRGQANAITLMILISATIVLALLLYQYFTGAYVQQSLVQQQIQILGYYANNIRVTVEAFTNSTNLTVTGGKYVYCGMFTVTNNGGDVLRPVMSILPGLQGADGLFHPDAAIAYFPVDYSQQPPVRGLLLWALEDLDHDGVIDMLAGTPGGPYTVVLNRTATCMEIFHNATLKLPQNSLVPENVTAVKVIVDVPTGMDLLPLVKQVYPDANETFYFPAWAFTMQPGESVSLYFYAESPVPLHRLSLIVMAPYEDKFLAAVYMAVWSEG